jgi:cell division protein FtsB
MNAIQPFEPNLDEINQINEKSPVILKRKMERQKKQRRNSNLEQAIETSVKIIINGLLTFVAFTTLTKLLPYHQSQQKKLAEIHQEVKETEARVSKLKEKFSGTFDSSQSKQVMQKNSHKIDPNQRRIFFY